VKILLLTFYYPPDLCAGSFRAGALVKALQEVGGRALQIEVRTTMPNRYQSLLTVTPEFEEFGGLSIRRVPLPSHRSGMYDQARAFLSFAKAVLRETRGKKWDVVVATSSRLMTAALGAQVAKRGGSPLYLDVRDLFTDTMSDLLEGQVLRILLPGFRQVERRVLKSAARINIVSPGFLDYVRAIVPEHEYRLFTNGIDEEFLQTEFAERGGELRRGLPVESHGDRCSRSLPLVLYAGNVGEGQGLHKVLPGAASSLQGKVRFRVIGDGGRRIELEKALLGAGVSNVELLSPIPRSQLYRHYEEADVLFLHLNDHPAFLKVLPSKLFEYGAIRKRILAGLSGYPADFIRKEITGAEVFEPCDAMGMTQALERLLAAKVTVDRAAFCAKYSRKKIMREMAQDILELGTR